MAAGDLPQNQPQHPSTADASDHPSDQDWQTVNFPNAMSVDQIPVADAADVPMLTPLNPAIPSSFIEIAPKVKSQPPQPTPAATPSVDCLQALQDCNQDLVERVAELEAQLDHCQETLREQETVLNQRNHELELAQEQVTRLFGKQELSNQVIQRQQVLVETLTQQWEASQAKMAQMERDCALTQQRYHEQQHELMQAQTMYRELRSRLHRQQRHTLQFKAALERCLEHSPRLEPSHRKPPGVPSPPLPQPPALDLTPIVTAKAPPVQPWSIPSDEADNAVETLEEILHTQEEEATEDYPETQRVISVSFNPFVNLVTHVSPETELPDDLQDSDISEINESDVEDSLDFDFGDSLEEWPQPQFIEDELDRIRSEYASLNEDDSELSLLEALPDFEPESLSSAQPESTKTIPVPKKPQVVSNWPSPVIQRQRHQKLNSLASIELPNLPKAYHWNAESTAVEPQPQGEVEPF